MKQTKQQDLLGYRIVRIHAEKHRKFYNKYLII